MTISPTVANGIFLSYGRNELARTELGKLLTAFGVDITTYHDAERDCGIATPTHRQVIDFAVSNCSAAIILLTPDDLAQLNPELGEEAVRFQPRPNVIEEMGFCWKAFGEGRTILVSLGSTTIGSNFDGRSILRLSNSPESRARLADNLRTAGFTITEVLLRSGQKVGSSGNFSNIVPEFEQEHYGDDIRAESGYVDGRIEKEVDPFKLIDEMQKAVKSGSDQPLPLKYHYVGPRMARYWRAVCDDREYGHAQLVDATESTLPDMVRNAGLSNKQINVVSLGPGDGKADIRLLRVIEEHVDIIRYLPMDISVDLLKLTVRAFEEAYEHRELTKEISIQTIQGDFEANLYAFEPIFRAPHARANGPLRNLFLLSGFTFGNAKEDDVLASIKAAMSDDDVLLLDLRLHGFGPTPPRQLDDTSSEELKRPYSSDIIARFAFGPVEEGTDFFVRIEDVEIDTEVRVGGSTAVPGAINVYMTCVGVGKALQTEVKRRQAISGHGDKAATARGAERIRRLRNLIPRRGIDEKMRLATVTFYDFESLDQWFQDRGMTVISKYRQNGFGVFGLKRST